MNPPERDSGLEPAASDATAGPRRYPTASDPTASDKAPWSPRGIALIAFFLSVLPGGILHALNFGRLGQPELKRRYLLTNSLLAMTLLFLAIATDLPVLFFVVTTLGFAVHVQVSQESRFRAFVAAGGKPARLWLPVFFSSVALLGLILLMFSAAFLESKLYERRFDRAVQLLEEERYDLAEPIFVDYQQAYPEDPNSYWNLAIIYSQTDRLEAARHQLRQSLRIDRDAEDVRQFLRELTADPVD